MEEQNIDINKQEYVREPKKKNTGKKILVVLLIFILILVGLGYWAYRQVTGIVKSDDLGVTYTTADYEELVENLGIEVDPEKLCLDCEPLSFSNPHEVDLRITDAQASAAFDIANKGLTFASINNSQIKFSEDKGELTTTVTYQGRDYSVYVSGNIEKDTETTISGEIFDLKIGGFNIPNSIKNMAQEALVDLGNDRLETMEDTFRIDDVKLTNEGLDFEGMVPQKGN